MQLKCNQKKIFKSTKKYVQNRGHGEVNLLFGIFHKHVINIEFSFGAWAGNGWNSMNTWTKTKLQVNKIIFESNFEIDNIRTNLNVIYNNDNYELLNELNYLNPNLDISQLEVINKTNTSVTIKAKNNSKKYTGEIKILYELFNINDNVIDISKLIKKGIFLVFKDKNQKIEIKEINTNNLIYSDVLATKSIEPMYNKNSKSICFGTIILENNLSSEQSMKTPIWGA